jgi:hypothetical protein
MKTRSFEPLKDIQKKVLQHEEWEGKSFHATRAGDHILEACRWALQRDGEGRPVGMLEINRDITEQTRALYAMEEQTRLLDLAMMRSYSVT